MFCSTRISGLLPRCTEVQLALMSISESVELLSHAAGLDSQELGGELVEVLTTDHESYTLKHTRILDG